MNDSIAEILNILIQKLSEDKSKEEQDKVAAKITEAIESLANITQRYSFKDRKETLCTFPDNSKLLIEVYEGKYTCYTYIPKNFIITKENASHTIGQNLINKPWLNIQKSKDLIDNEAPNAALDPLFKAIEDHVSAKNQPKRNRPKY